MNKLKEIEIIYNLDCRDKTEKTEVFEIMYFKNLMKTVTEMTLKQIEIEIRNKAPGFQMGSIKQLTVVYNENEELNN